jgi:SPP1 family predicted phage head-tail adaptor
MNAGPLRHVVTLQAPVETKDAVGVVAKDWLTLGHFRANVRTLSGREAMLAKQTVASATIGVTLRHLGMSYPITCQHRILFGDSVLGISNVNNVGNRNRQYELLCEELPA